MFVASNYSAIFERIAQPARERAEIVLGKKVVLVSIPEDRGSSNQVEVTTEDGSKLEFDEVVMTTPLGWLQRNLSRFQPALPPRLESAFHSLKLSQLENFFIRFLSAWWITDSTTDSFPSYTNWLSPQYTADTNPAGWPQEIWNLAAFAEPNRHPTMLFYLYGDCSRFIAGRDHDMDREKHRFLDEFFRPLYSRLPNFDAESPECQPKAFIVTDWLTDELSGLGSYCNFQVGVEEADKDIETIRDGCPQRRLWFCGEHAAPFEECGTVAGAYLSGESAASKIISMYDPARDS
jgi:monoamine oxidase